MDKIDELMKELNAAHKRKDYADMANIVQLELLPALKEIESD